MFKQQIKLLRPNPQKHRKTQPIRFFFHYLKVTEEISNIQYQIPNIQLPLKKPLILLILLILLIPLCYTQRMNPSDDDRRQDDISSDLFPNAGQRLSSHNFYGSEPTNPSQNDSNEQDTSEQENFCPRCDAPLEIREGALGKYIACTRFPDCKFTQPYDDISTPPQEQNYDDDEKIEKDYLKEAADELSGDGYANDPAPDEKLGGSNGYDEQETSALNEPTDYDSHPHSYGEASESKQVEEFPNEEFNEEPYIETTPEVETVDSQPEPIHEGPEEHLQTEEEVRRQPRPQGNHAFLPHHPIWLKTKAVTDGSNWVELKQKRQIAQKAGGFSPAKPAAPGIVMPSPEELAETLRNLEANVQKLQKDEEEIVPPIAQKQPSTSPDEYDDDILPESIRQALNKKSED